MPGGSGVVRDRQLHSRSVMVLACRKSVFLDQLVQLRSEQGGVAEPDVRVWLPMVGRPQSAAKGPLFHVSSCPGAVAEAIAGGSERVTVSSGLAENKT